MSKRSSQVTVSRSLILGAALAACAGAASAQSNVTLYGRLDAAVQYSSKLATVDDSRVELANGGIRPSIWGLRGTEDLGGGLSAFFNLEAHFATDTGAATGPGAGQLGSGGFRRQANVGLKGGWGSVTLGRQYSPAILANLGTEPRAFKENLSGLYPYAFNQFPAGNTVNDLGIFIGNSVVYSNNFGPVYVGLGVGAGEGVGRTEVIGANYTTNAFTVSGSYQNIDGPADGSGTKHWMVGAALPLGPFTIKASYQGSKEDLLGTEISKVKFFGIGADWAWASNHTFNITYYDGKDDDNSGDKTKTLVISNDYAISKRTTIYAQYAIADADPGATARTSVIANGNFPDEKTSVIALGIMHNF